MRLSPDTGKKDCQIIDFIDIAGRTPGLVSTPTLFGLDPSEVVDGTVHFFSLPKEGSDRWTDESLESLRERANAGFPVKDANTPLGVPSPESVTYVDYEDPFALIGENCGTTPVIQQLSPLAWVGVGSDFYVLECLGAGFIRVEPLIDPKGDPNLFPNLEPSNLKIKSRTQSSKHIIPLLRWIRPQRRRLSVRHTCVPVASCKRTASNKLSEAPICTQRKMWLEVQGFSGS